MKIKLLLVLTIFFTDKLIIDTFDVKYCSVLTQYYKIYLKIVTFLSE